MPRAAHGSTIAGVPVSSYHYLVGPLIACLALGVIILICRWVFSTDHRDDRTTRRLAKLANQGDYGLLVPVATVRTRDDAEMLRTVLASESIRATLGPPPPGQPGTQVLVFRDDAARARDLVGSQP